ncbi:MAG: 2-hydroxychromene-2-carboxylate isomerase [Proteobacteria bacterium]|nr:2-hydroxychromene-2-carboxylate isomerase [Pseudomonadota bacterium]
MSQPIDFYFDFASPYGYLASRKIDEIAARYARNVTWHPFLLGVVFKIVGTAPMFDYPLKSDYFLRDLPRSARRLGIPVTLPPGAPHNTIAAARTFYWLNDTDAERAKAFAKRIYDRFFEDGDDVSSPEAAVEIAAEVGADRDQAIAALQDQTVKDRLRTENEAAIARGVFGSPYFIVDDEPFWGSDRLVQVEAWIKSGGW